jgi:hypothetical protein
VNRRNPYELVAIGTLAMSAIGAVLATAGAILQQALGALAASLCALVFVVPGLYFLAHARRLRARDVALAHAATFVRGHAAIRVQDLAEELRVAREDAERILRIAVREGFLRGRFEGTDRFVADPDSVGPAGGSR